jgi:SAM-dependent methyltransferase
MIQLIKRYLKPETRRWLRQVLGKERTMWVRIAMQRETLRLVQTLPCGDLDAVEISGDDWSSIGFRSYKHLDYPEFDICDGPFGEGVCDLVFLEQVLEHVRKPAEALQNVRTMLRPGGRALITTPFLIKFHPAPGIYGDYYRWTEDGMRILLEESGFTNVVTGSWGNRQCLRANLTPDPEWVNYNPLFHSLKNEPRFPLTVWAMAQRT